MTSFHSLSWARRLVVAAVLIHPAYASAQTIALWPFDEPKGLYPSCVLDDVSVSNYPLVLGPGGQIVEGKFGNALDAAAQPPVRYPDGGSILFGLSPVPIPAGRTVEPMTWKNAMFCALMTGGERHLRKEVGFANPTSTKLNLADFDWTVEFWFLVSRKTNTPGVVFEIGSGPRGENDLVTRLTLADDNKSFLLFNQPSGTRLLMPTDAAAVDPAARRWHHFAFVYSRAEAKLRHYVDGVEQAPSGKVTLRGLPRGEEAYLSVGRDGLWQRPLPGRIDELRFSEGRIYTSGFTPPASFSPPLQPGVPAATLKKGPPLLFAGASTHQTIVPLLDRKYLFIDGAIAESLKDVTFVVNPPRLAERVFGPVKGPFRKHLNVVEDEKGLLRIYFGVQNDFLAVLTSKDGINWEKPVLNASAAPDMQNVVLAEPTGTGQVFLDPNAPDQERWRFISGYGGRGIYLFSSPDGWSFKRHRTAALPFRSGSQSNIFYDDQRQVYVSYHRSDYHTTLDGKTQREFVMTETRNLEKPWPFVPASQRDGEKIGSTERLHNLNPWYLDNGPLTPGGFGIEYPAVFAPDDSLDPPGTDIYVPKTMKYPWAPDTYFAFPLIYFHYEEEGPAARRTLGEERRQLGSGPLEAQLAVSRDGIHWKRYPRPAYVGIGEHAGDIIHQAYLAQGMVRRGSEIWQYYFGEEGYHSSWRRDTKRAIYRVVQRVDGFVSADSPYDRPGMIVTRPLVFKGNRLVLNLDTGAAGYVQLGLLDGRSRPIEGYSLDDCVYINGNFTEIEAEWLGKGKDLTALQGQPVHLVIRTRGTKLYSMQFVQR
jgi:hypothetical protein